QSRVHTYTVPSRIATPRFTRGNPRLCTVSGIGRLHSHSGRPLFRSSATTVAGAPAVTYITPSATTGVTSSAPVPGGWYNHMGRSRLTFSREICVSGENRSERYDPEYESHCPSSAVPFARRMYATCAPSGASINTKAATAEIVVFIAHPEALTDTRRDRPARPASGATRTTASAWHRARAQFSSTQSSRDCKPRRNRREGESRTRLR